MALIVFDFDATLFDTPTKEVGEVKYLEIKGRELKSHWYTIPFSLNQKYFDIKPINHNMKLYHQYIETSNEVVLMSGRPKELRLEVRNLLIEFGFVFDSILLKPKGGDTFIFKMQELSKMIEEHSEILFIDDRPKHLKPFITYAELVKPKCRLSIINSVTQEACTWVDAKLFDPKVNYDKIEVLYDGKIVKCYYKPMKGNFVNVETQEIVPSKIWRNIITLE